MIHDLWIPILWLGISGLASYIATRYCGWYAYDSALFLFWPLGVMLAPLFLVVLGPGLLGSWLRGRAQEDR